MEQITINEMHHILKEISKKLDSLNEKFSLSVEQKIIPFRKRDDLAVYLKESDITKALETHSVSSELKLFKLIYLSNNKKNSVVSSGAKTFKYFDGEEWHIDKGGSNIAQCFLNNVSILYMKINQIENYKDNAAKFLKNQQHILNLKNSKNIKTFITKLTKLLK